MIVERRTVEAPVPGAVNGQTMQRELPQLPPGAFKSYTILAPLATHFRKATCEEVGCENHAHGWRLRVEGMQPADLYTAKTCGRRYDEVQVAAGETYLVFQAGQPCFAASQHKVRVERPELYVVSGGDWRANPSGERFQHSGSADWVDDFAENQDTIATRIARG
jgi:hypothetical protein